MEMTFSLYYQNRDNIVNGNKRTTICVMRRTLTTTSGPIHPANDENAMSFEKMITSFIEIAGNLLVESFSQNIKKDMQHCPTCGHRDNSLFTKKHLTRMLQLRTYAFIWAELIRNKGINSLKDFYIQLDSLLKTHPLHYNNLINMRKGLPMTFDPTFTEDQSKELVKIIDSIEDFTGNIRMLMTYNYNL